MVDKIKKLLQDEEGQTLAEYALLVALISVGLIVVLTSTRNQIRSIFSSIADTLSSAVTRAGS